MKDKFKLLQDVGKYKKGKVFTSYGGIVSGIVNSENNQPINFNNKKYFKLI